MKKFILLVVLVMLAACSSLNQRKNNLGFNESLQFKVNYITPKPVMNLSILPRSEGIYTKVMLQQISGIFSEDTKARDVIIRVAYRPGQPPQYALTSLPSFGSSTRETYLHRLQALPGPPKVYESFEVEFYLRYNGGYKGSSELEPTALITDTLATDGCNLATLYSMLQAENNRIKGLLPALGRSYSEKRRYVQELAATADSGQDPCKNSAWWNSLLEVKSADQYQALVKVVSLGANGRYDEARRWLETASCFSSDRYAADYFLRRLSKLYTAFYSTLDQQLKQASTQNPAQAQTEYLSLLSSYPWASMVAADLIMSQEKAAGDEKRLYDLFNTQVLDNDFMAVGPPVALAPRDAFLKHLRLMAAGSSSDKDKYYNLRQKANLALYSGHLDYAGMVYWLLYQTIPDDDIADEMKENFLYCAHKCGTETPAEKLEVDTTRIYPLIDKQLRQIPAQDTYAALVSTTSRRADDYLDLAKRSLAAGEPYFALQNYRRALQYKPGSVDTWVDLGCLYYQMKLVAEATDAWITATRIDETSSRMAGVKLALQANDNQWPSLLTPEELTQGPAVLTQMFAIFNRSRSGEHYTDELDALPRAILAADLKKTDVQPLYFWLENTGFSKKELTLFTSMLNMFP